MKRIIALLVLLAVSVQSATVNFDLSDFVTTQIKRRTVYITPLSTPSTNATSIITSDSIRFFTDSDGLLTVTNFQYGNYGVNIFGPSTNTTFNILVPDGTNTYDAKDLIVSSLTVPAASSGYSQSAANALFVLRLNGWATNLLTTNLLINPGTGTSNYVWTLTNTVTGAGEWREAQGASGTPRFDSTGFTWDQL